MTKIKILGVKIVNAKIKCIFSVFTLTGLLLLTGCTPYHAQKAPCDRFGTGCGAKIRINAC